MTTSPARRHALRAALLCTAALGREPLGRGTEHLADANP